MNKIKGGKKKKSEKIDTLKLNKQQQLTTTKKKE